ILSLQSLPHPSNPASHRHVFLRYLGGVGGSVTSESALRSAGPFCRGFEPCRRRPGLTEDLRALDHLVVDWLHTKTKPFRYLAYL
ncbi:hypothetical protein PoB_001546400, partial [Plakobranchus ocellatus]